MVQHAAKHSNGQSPTEQMHCQGVGSAQVRKNGTATIQLWISEGQQDEPGALILDLTDDQRRLLRERLKEPA